MALYRLNIKIAARPMLNIFDFLTFNARMKRNLTFGKLMLIQVNVKIKKTILKLQYFFFFKLQIKIFSNHLTTFAIVNLINLKIKLNNLFKE